MPKSPSSGPKSPSPGSKSAPWTLDYVAPEPGEPSACLQLHPGDLRSLGFLPGELLLVLQASLPLYLGSAWPCKRVAASQVRLQCLSSLAEASLSSRTASAGAGAVAEAESAAPAVTLQRAATSASLPPPASAVHVVRGMPLDEDRRGGPSLTTLRTAVLGLVLPLEGLRVQLPPTGKDGAAGEQHLRLLPILGGAGLSPDSQQPACCHVAHDTAFYEGAPPGHPAAAAPAGSLQPAAALPLLGGLGPQLSQLLQLARSALQHTQQQQQHHHHHLRPAQGALLSGPPGTGKTLLARALGTSLGVTPVIVNGPELLSDTVGETEARLRSAWLRAGQAGGLLFLDEVDALCPSRQGGGVGEVEARVLAQLCALMDASSTQQGGSSLPVFVLGATNRPGALDASLRRPGRFDVEVHIGVPSAGDRCEILWACLGAYRHAVPRQQADAVCLGRMHGYVGADVAAACREAAWCALRRALAGGREGQQAQGAGAAAAAAGAAGADTGIDTVTASMGGLSLSAAPPSPSPSTSTSPDPAPAALTLDDLLSGLCRMQPSALRDTAVEVAATPWASIAGSAPVKARLQEAIEWPARYPALFAALGVTPTRGILLYGPPGCSKTMMARAMATSGSMNFISVKGPELLSKYVGDSEKAVAGVFAKARAAAPCVLFFDEFDSLGSARDGGEGEGGSSSSSSGVGVRVVAQLLQEMDGSRGGGGSSSGSGGGVVVVAATNRPDLIDPALLRPGRMDYLLYVGLPEASARAEIAAAHLATLPPGSLEPGLQSGQAVGLATEGCSGAEVLGVLREAAGAVLAEALEGGGGEGQGGGGVLGMRHVLAAARSCPRQVTGEMLAWYSKWESSRGRS